MYTYISSGLREASDFLDPGTLTAAHEFSRREGIHYCDYTCYRYRNSIV